MKIGEHEIGKGGAYIIAELSANHNQDFESALQLVHAAKEAGANAVKLQTYRPDTITIDCDNDHFKIDGTLWAGQSLYQLYEKAYTPWEWHEPLQKAAHDMGMDFFTSPFDITAVDFLETLDVPVYKVASFEVSDHILLKKIAQTGKPVIMSTGASDLKEITEAVYVLRENGCKDLCILKCTSAYPAAIEDANLRSIPMLKQMFGVEAGLSDHTLGIEVPIAAVCLGATIVEKHLTLSRNSGSPDDEFSLEPDEFKQMVSGIRKAEAALGSVQFTEKSKQFKRSLFVVKDIAAGEEITEDNIRSIRPGNGLHTRYYDQVCGLIAVRNLPRGTPLSWDALI